MFSADRLRALATDIFAALGVPRSDAAVAADVLVAADLRGVDSHGVGRLILYYNDITSGATDPITRLTTVRDLPGIAVVDANNGLGQVAGYHAMRLCVEKARQVGVASVAVRGSNHFGSASYYAMMALPHDLIGLALTNSAPVIAPPGVRKAVLGSNPIAVAVPAGRERPFVLDMATSVVPLGRLEVAMRAGERIPLGWAVDRNGRPTSDPAEAYWHGGMTPLGAMPDGGGHKGYGLALAFDILTGVLSGAHFGSQLPNWQKPHTDPTDMGHFFTAWRIDAFLPLEEFKARMDEEIRLMREAPRADGVDRIYIPGEIEFEMADRRNREGIPLQPKVVETLRRIATELHVECSVLDAD